MLSTFLTEILFNDGQINEHFIRKVENVTLDNDW